jgi:fructokinase
MRIGIDLGGTKIEGIALDGAGAERARRRVATPGGDYAATIGAVCALVADLEDEAGAEAAGIGIGIPGAVSPATGLIKNANSTWLIGKPLGRDLEAALGRPVRLANDANCFAVSEAADGAGRGSGMVFGVILGTGVGGGLVIDGKTVTGPNAIAGEWGHNPLPWPSDDERPGPACYCGLRGCIETFLSGPGLARDFRQAGGDNLAAPDIVALAGDATKAEGALAEAALDRYEHRLARALASVINILDPDVIILGGGLSNVGRLYENVPALWSDWVFSECSQTRLLANVHGDSSGVRGAAWLWDE